MVNRDEVMQIVNWRLGRLLSVAEGFLTPQQFKAFRKLALDEFGGCGMASELEQLERGRGGRAP